MVKLCSIVQHDVVTLNERHMRNKNYGTDLNTRAHPCVDSRLKLLLFPIIEYESEKMKIKKIAAEEFKDFSEPLKITMALALYFVTFLLIFIESKQSLVTFSALLTIHSFCA